MTQARRHAVVVGSGIAGLLAARVLTRHYDRVTVLDRDRFPTTPDHRPGTPQSHHVHGLQPRGAEVIDELFPEVRHRLQDRGATVVDDPGQVRIVTQAGVLPLDGVTGTSAVISSRLLLEWQLREILREHPAVEFLAGVEVTGLEADGSTVCGVRVRRRRSSGPGTDVVLADLVVDASGRRSPLPEWLAGLGHGPVPEETLSSEMSYASRFYERPEGCPDDVALVLILGRAPHSPRVGLIEQIERGRWHVSLAGLNGEKAPTDDAGFLRWAGELPDPTLYEMIRVARPTTPIRGWRTPTSRWRHLERLAGWPSGLVAVGDAVCALNPTYGQGMSVAAVEALVLDRCLEEHGSRAGFERRFQRRVARTVAHPWLVASSDELRWSNVRLHGGRPSRGLPVLRRYLEVLVRAAMHDPVLAARYFAVISMKSTPASLVAPRVLARVLRHRVLRRSLAAEPVAGRIALSAHDLETLRAMPAYESASPGG